MAKDVETSGGNPEALVVDEISRLVDAQLAEGEVRPTAEEAVRWMFDDGTPDDVVSEVVRKLREQSNRHSGAEEDADAFVIECDALDCLASIEVYTAVGEEALPLHLGVRGWISDAAGHDYCPRHRGLSASG